MSSAPQLTISSIHENAVEAINKSGIALLEYGTARNFKENPKEPFLSRREMETITDKDIISVDKMAYTDITGRTVARYFAREKQEVGLFDEEYGKLRKLVEKVSKTSPFDRGFSNEFIEDAIFDWWIKSYRREPIVTLVNHIITKVNGAVSEHHLVVPISAIEIERPFEIGGVLVAPMNKQMLIDMKTNTKTKNPEYAELADKRFSEIIRELGHLTCIHVKVRGEPKFAKSHAEKLAFQIAEMFRFMSPAALSWNVSFPCLPHGCHSHRSTTVLTIQDEKILNISQGILEYGMFSWKLSFKELDEHMKSGFFNFSLFLEENHKDEFQERVRKSISTFSEGVITHNASNRLVYAMSALEHLFLRGSQEPIQAGVGDRLAFMLTKDGERRKNIVLNFKKAYGLRSKQIHHLSTVDDEGVLQEFFQNSWIALHHALKIMPKFKTHSQFLDAIDNVKYGVG